MQEEGTNGEGINDVDAGVGVVVAVVNMMQMERKMQGEVMGKDK